MTTVVDKAIRESSSECIFSNLAPNIIYLAGYKENYKINAVNYPFMIDNSGLLKFFRPHDYHLTALLSRKYSYRLPISQIKTWYKSLENSTIQAANQKDFSDAYTLKTFDKFKNGLPKKIEIQQASNHQYFRFIAQDSSKIHLATCKLYDHKGKEVKATIFATVNYWNHEERTNFSENKVELMLLEKVLDENPLTYIDPDKGLVITYQLDTPQQVSYFLIQARNDDNYIRLGDTYELFYWDKYWKSLGRQIAEQNSLVYEKVPKNAIYWLKNLSRGQEEHVFLLSEDGQQIWPGNKEADEALSLKR